MTMHARCSLLCGREIAPPKIVWDSGPRIVQAAQVQGEPPLAADFRLNTRLERAEKIEYRLLIGRRQGAEISDHRIGFRWRELSSLRRRMLLDGDE